MATSLCRAVSTSSQKSPWFFVDVAAEAIKECGHSSGGEQASSLSAKSILGIAMCDVDATHQSYISDEKDYRFQMPVAIFGHEQGRHAGGKAYEWGACELHLKRNVHMRLVNVGAANRVSTRKDLLAKRAGYLCSSGIQPAS